MTDYDDFHEMLEADTTLVLDRKRYNELLTIERRYYDVLDNLKIFIESEVAHLPRGA